MTELEILKGALSQFADSDEENFNLALSCWKLKTAY